MPPARAHLEYTLYIRLAQIEPPIWRRIVVPANLTLHQLHQVLQVTMGWTHSHLHQFLVPGTQESIYYGEPSPEDDYFHKDDRRVRLAIEVFCHRARKYIGAFLASMGGADAVVFTGGIGENSAVIREAICANLDWFGIALDEEKNKSAKGEMRIDAATELREHAAEESQALRETKKRLARERRPT